MRILLDTHMILWAMTDDMRLPEKARDLISDSSNELFFSIASVWEIAIKHAFKPAKMLINGKEFLEKCEFFGLTPLLINDKHVIVLETLKRADQAPPHHDPFDRIMIAQAKCEALSFLTHDSLLPYYQESCIMYV